MHIFFRWFGLPGRFVLTVLLSILSVVLALISQTAVGVLCMIAMILSSLGDIILMDYKPVVSHFPFKGFEAGALMFALAHGLYAAAYILKNIKADMKRFNIGTLFSIILFLLSVAVLTSLMIRNKKKSIGMYILGIAYLIFITVNCSAIFTFGVNYFPLGLVSIVGAVSFFISDLFLAFDKIGCIKIKNLTNIVWWFYPIGQILILVGAVL